MSIIKPNAFIGIDPGVAKDTPGACVCVYEQTAIPGGWTKITGFDWPGSPDMACAELRQWDKDFRIRMAVLEEPGMRPAPKGKGKASGGKQVRGVIAAYKVGGNFGHWEGILVGLGIPRRVLPPKEWQREVFGPEVRGTTTKEKSINAACALLAEGQEFISLKKHHGRADALNMAMVAKRIWMLETSRIQ